MKLLDKDGLTYYTGKIKNELTDYVKNTDYANSTTGGVVKADSFYGFYADDNGKARSQTYDYNYYANTLHSRAFISKGTLENVITGKELVNKTYVDNIVGDIESLLAEV